MNPNQMKRTFDAINRSNLGGQGVTPGKPNAHVSWPMKELRTRPGLAQKVCPYLVRLGRALEVKPNSSASLRPYLGSTGFRHKSLHLTSVQKQRDLLLVTILYERTTFAVTPS